MNKKLLFLLVGMVLILLAGCGQDTKYESLMNKAEKAMEDFNVDEALKHYHAIMEINPKDLPYADTRRMIVQSLIDNTEGLKENIDELEDATEAVTKAYDKLDFSYNNLSELEEFSVEIISLLSQLESYPNTSLYKDIAEMKKEFDANIDEKIVKALKEDIDKDLEQILFQSAEEKVKSLNRIQASFNIEIAGLDKYDEKIEYERTKYISFPFQISERNKVMFEDKNIGKVTYLGEGMADGGLVAYYKFEGDLRSVANDLDMEIRYIYADGNYRDSSSYSLTHYKDYVIADQVISTDEVEVKRIDYHFNFMEDETIQTINLDDAKKEMTIDGVMAYDEQSFTTDMVFEDEEKKVELNSMTVQRNKITLNGKTTSKVDTVVSDKVYLGRPLFNTVNSESFYQQLFNGISKEFKVEIGLDKPLHADEKFVQLNFLGNHMNIDLSNGKEFKGSEVDFLDFTFFKNDSAKLQFYYDTNTNSFFEDVAGKKYANVLSLVQYYSEPGQITIPISKKYKTFTVDVGIDKRYAEAGYGSSKILFESNGKVMKEINLAANAATTPVELDVSEVDSLVITIIQTPSDLGRQTVLLGNGKFQMK